MQDRVTVPLDGLKWRRIAAGFLYSILVFAAIMMMTFTYYMPMSSKGSAADHDADHGDFGLDG
jgi:hypothetical protein